MKTICLHDRDQIERFLRRNIFLHLYSLGDLEDHFWPFTTWYALADGPEVKALALLYSGLSMPTLLALGDENETPFLSELLQSMFGLLPPRFYAHLSPGLADVLGHKYRINSHGPHLKMALTDTTRLAGVGLGSVVALSTADAGELLAFYDASYPGHRFEQCMLEAHPYFGLRGRQGLVSVAGVHVYSPRYKVAAPGTIATHPAQRGQGYARVVTAALCRSLLQTVSHIGLNVKADNAPALRCYEALGFHTIASYEECEAVLRPRGE